MDYRQAARENVDRHLGDVVTGEEDQDISEEVYVLAFDGAKDAGATMEEAQWAADHVSEEFSH